MKRFFGISAVLMIALVTTAVFTVIVIGQNSFYTEAAQSNMAEIELSQMALQKSNNEEIKQFAQRMIDDHTKANEELQELAANKGVTLPSEPDEDQKETAEELSELSDEDFDEEYMDVQVSDHETVIGFFEIEADEGSDADVIAFASKTLPKLRAHLEMAESISSDL
jgi:putative membrane protein